MTGALKEESVEFVKLLDGSVDSDSTTLRRFRLGRDLFTASWKRIERKRSNWEVTTHSRSLRIKTCRIMNDE